MKRLGYDLSLILSALVLVVLVGCKQESPADKAKAAGSGNTTPVAGQEVIDAMKTPMDDARQAEGKLEKSAEETAAAIKKSTE